MGGEERGVGGGFWGGEGGNGGMRDWGGGGGKGEGDWGRGRGKGKKSKGGGGEREDGRRPRVAGRNIKQECLHCSKTISGATHNLP